METKDLTLTLDISKESLSNCDNIYVAEFQEIELVSQGSTIEQAKLNAIEALTLLVECASSSELKRRLPIERSSN